MQMTTLNSRWPILGLLALGLLLGVTDAWAARKGEVLEYGYYEFIDGPERSSQAAVTSGYVQTGKARLVKQTERIPIEQGRLFGFRFRISGLDPSVGVIPLELVVRHPPMEKPDGSVSTGYRYPVELKLEQGQVEDQTGYRLNEPYEMVEGEWLFEYRIMNKPLLVQRFFTYRP